MQFDKSKLISTVSSLFRSKVVRTWSLRIILSIWLITLGFWLYDNQSNSEAIFQDEFLQDYYLESHTNFQTIDEYLKSLEPAYNEAFPMGRLVHSRTYDNLTKKYDLTYLLKDTTFQERCDLYFKELYQQKPNWNIDLDYDFSFDRDGYSTLEKYKEKKIEEYKNNEAKEKEIKKSEVVVTDKKIKEIEANHVEVVARIAEHEKLIHDYLTHVKVFNKCYILSSSIPERVSVTNFVNNQKSELANIDLDKTSKKLKSKSKSKSLKNSQSFQDLESRIYPWLTGVLPTFTRWDGKVIKNALPQMCKYTAQECVSVNAEANIKSSFVERKPGFMKKFRQGLNGRGIGLTISNSHVVMAIRFIRLLRALDNELPIEIIYVSDLNAESRNQLIEASREPLSDGSGKVLKAQELWFVDVSPAVNKKYHGKFGGFGNKILATIFNSFNEFILVDADTVMLKAPDYFFNLPKYQQYGTFYYKDRSAAEFRPKDDTTFFRKMMPSQLDTAMFGIPQITDYTLKREFFKGMSHYMESGLVVINRERHFTKGFIMAQLNAIKPAHDRLYGDKELFWLAHTVSGDESYYFNKHFSAAIGEVTPDRERNANLKEKKPNFKSKEICSNHPAHINDQDDHTLLWFNSGFQFCGQTAKVDFKSEFEHKDRYTQFNSLSSFQAFFTSKLGIKEAVIPPVNFDIGMDQPNKDDEPSRGWVNARNYCNGYTWCAYSSIGSDKEGETNNIQEGLYIKYTDDETKLFDYLGGIWTYPFDFRSDKQVEIDRIEAIKKAKEDEEKKKKKEEEDLKKKEEEEKKKKEEDEKKKKEEDEKKKKEEDDKKKEEEGEMKSDEDFKKN
ncbi:putative alpha-1,3-mannosyltransferase Mnn14p [[Candida] anglica]